MHISRSDALAPQPPLPDDVAPLSPLSDAMWPSDFVHVPRRAHNTRTDRIESLSLNFETQLSLSRAQQPVAYVQRSCRARYAGHTASGTRPSCVICGLDRRFHKAPVQSDLPVRAHLVVTCYVGQPRWWSNHGEGDTFSVV